MATLFDVNRVKYRCSCGRFKPLAYLYFCKHCVTLKCKECVLHEIDPKYYCGYCLDNKTSKEASQLKYKCSTCFNCPLCDHILTIRGSSINAGQKGPSSKSPQNEQKPDTNTTSTSQQPQIQKVFYLACSFCRWTTRDVGLPDATSIPGSWKIQENSNSKRIDDLLEGYRSLALKEKGEKDRKKYSYGKRKFFQPHNTNDMFGILTPIQKLLQTANITNQSANELQFKELIPSIGTNVFDEIPDDYHTTKIDINSITSVKQRLANPELQIENCNGLVPLSKSFITKESKRCNVCEHNVVKPENNIVSTKFKLHQMALFMVPEIRIVTIPKWKLNERNRVILSITNKCESEVNVTLISNENGQNSNIFFANETFTVDRQDAKSLNVSLKSVDNPNYICYRKDNKVAIYCDVIPLNDDVDVECDFQMNHSYYGMSVDLQATPVMQTLEQFVHVNFGSFKTEKEISKPKYIEDCLNIQMK